ncbi:MAG TPA: DUF3267 domain-containing protein [Anaerolineales bacterium]|nr:DUF3267 domain-containing protein [Anaerolineales bacterium]
MRLHIGKNPVESPPSPIPEGWRSIRQPGPFLSFLLSALLFPCALTTGLVALDIIVAGTDNTSSAPTNGVPWGVILLALLLFIPTHEALHLAFHPGLGRTPRSHLVIWLSKLRFGVYFDGCMTRTRWLIMRSAPFVVLSMLPIAILGLMKDSSSGSTLSIFLQFMMIFNGIGSSGDGAAMVLVLIQVPPSSSLCFQEGRAYWTQGIIRK